ncbi:phosphatidylinositol glycan, class H [Capronia epimyces CBS 606.96]|uniref:Phosphatidylinositol glycan, class H n=1 Tax=Capronia epimyces CBS 606.96 TaxID=1182542 RepID=W9XZQ0_9EURO|nr:phosphatidylinositol glycan, class H [Capronia epimyces CBS 606.96]EXJ82830.1 phosphatidylinositol glycan, class H [Capronia epimyces CBS 606.96]
MFTGTTQYLEVYLPSPTTVSFTVTTRRPRRPTATSTSTPTSKSRFKHRLRFFKSHILTLTVLRHVVRLVLVFYALLLNVAKAQHHRHHHHHQQDTTELNCAFDKYAQLALQLSLGGGLVKTLAERTEWWILVPLSLAVIYLCLRRDYVEESLLVLQGLGIQTSTSSRYFFMGATTTFIPTTQIQDIVIHEAFQGLAVRFYLAVIVEGATEVVVVFPVRQDAFVPRGSIDHIMSTI